MSSKTFLLMVHYLLEKVIVRTYQESRSPLDVMDPALSQLNTIYVITSFCLKTHLLSLPHLPLVTSAVN